MVKIREKQTEQLEKAASKGLKLGGWKKMTLSSKIAAVVLVLVALTAILAPLLAPYSPGRDLYGSPGSWQRIYLRYRR